MCEDINTDSKQQQNTKENFFLLNKDEENSVTLSRVTCHQRQQPQPQTLPLLTSPICKLGWFAKTDIFVLENMAVYPKNPKKIQFKLFFFKSSKKNLVHNFSIIEKHSLSQKLPINTVKKVVTAQTTNRWTLLKPTEST